MEKSKTKNEKRQNKAGRIILILGCIGLVTYLAPIVLILLGSWIVPWTLLPASYPNATIIYEDASLVDPTELYVTYCTSATIEQLQAFFAPMNPQYSLSLTASFYDVSNTYSDIFFLGIKSSMTLYLADTHPECSSGAVYSVLVYVAP